MANKPPYRVEPLLAQNVSAEDLPISKATQAAIDAIEVTDKSIQLSDNTDNDVTTIRHGFVPKATGVGNYLKDDGTWSAIPAGYTDEQAQDAVGTMVDGSLVYVDATPLLTRAALTGDITASQGSNTTTIANGAVTLAKQANVAQDTVFYRKSSGAGAPEVQTLATLKTDLGLTGTNSGDQDLSGLMVKTNNLSDLINAATAVQNLGLKTAANLNMKTIVCVWDGQGGVISTGNTRYVTIPFSGTITAWNITATGTNPTCTIDIWKVATGTTLPVVGNSIMGTKPALSTGNAIHSTTLTGWGTSVAANDIMAFNIDAVSAATTLVIVLEITLA